MTAAPPLAFIPDIAEEHLEELHEGAAFVLLSTREAAGAMGLPVLATLGGFGAGFEPGHLYSEAPYRGDGLAGAFEQLLAPGVPGPIEEVYSSMNGENHWAKEWGVAFLRHQGAFRSDHGMHHPADCFGDTGAACGAVMVRIAARGIRDGYRRTPTLVVRVVRQRSPCRASSGRCLAAATFTCSDKRRLDLGCLEQRSRTCAASRTKGAGA